jgi:hypothetical protein
MSELDGLAAPGVLRELVREVLRDVLPELAGQPPAQPPSGVPVASAASSAAAPPAAAAQNGDGGVQAVRLRTDAELHEFVLKVMRLADNPARRADIVAGRLRFTLAGQDDGVGGPAAVQRVDKGAVTERAVIAAARAGARLVLGPRAVLTPLARDKARALGVPVEKER